MKSAMKCVAAAYMSQGHWLPRRHFRTHKNGPENGSKQRNRSAGAPQGLVAAVAAPRPICEAFLSTMITAATASRPPFDPADWGGRELPRSR